MVIFQIQDHNPESLVTARNLTMLTAKRYIFNVAMKIVDLSPIQGKINSHYCTIHATYSSRLNRSKHGGAKVIA